MMGDAVLGLAVAVIVVHPVWWLAGGRRALGAGWWVVSGVAWLMVMWWLSGADRFWEGWACGAMAVLCMSEARLRCYRVTRWKRSFLKGSSGQPPTA